MVLETPTEARLFRGAERIPDPLPKGIRDGLLALRSDRELQRGVELHDLVAAGAAGVVALDLDAATVAQLTVEEGVELLDDGTPVDRGLVASRFAVTHHGRSFHPVRLRWRVHAPYRSRTTTSAALFFHGAVGT